MRHKTILDAVQGVEVPVVENVLNEAERIIYGDREMTYGDPGKNLRQIAAYWSTLFGVEVTAEKVALAMVLLKVAREQHQHKRDNLVDACGYMALIERVKQCPTK